MAVKGEAALWRTEAPGYPNVIKLCQCMRGVVGGTGLEDWRSRWEHLLARTRKVGAVGDHAFREGTAPGCRGSETSGTGRRSCAQMT